MSTSPALESAVAAPDGGQGGHGGHAGRRQLFTLALASLGVVFGDIGTSPLYAFRESFIGPHRLPIDPVNVMGVLSLIFWALVLVVTVKYVLITMRADNRGEGGSFALLALIPAAMLSRSQRRARTTLWQASWTTSTGSIAC